MRSLAYIFITLHGVITCIAQQTYLPKCTPKQLANGYWDNETWVPTGDCHFHWFTQEESSKCLENATVLFAGNSITRHLMFQLRQTLLGRDDILERTWEKVVCPKPDKPVSEWAQPYSEEKLQLNGLCYGYCTCSATAGTTKLHFIWQVNWFDEEIHQFYDSHFNSSLDDPPSLFTVNAGLNIAWTTPAVAFEQAQEQFPKLLSYLETKTRNATVIYRLSTATCPGPIQSKMEEIDSFVESAIPANSSVLTLDVSISTKNQSHYGERDCNHHPGPQAKLHVNMLLYLHCYDKLQLQHSIPNQKLDL